MGINLITDILHLLQQTRQNNENIRELADSNDLLGVSIRAKANILFDSKTETIGALDWLIKNNPDIFNKPKDPDVGLEIRLKQLFSEFRAEILGELNLVQSNIVASLNMQQSQVVPVSNIDNLISSKVINDTNSIDKEELEFMRKIKGVGPKRKDGRYRWRVQINGVFYTTYTKTIYEMPDAIKREINRVLATNNIVLESVTARKFKIIMKSMDILAKEAVVEEKRAERKQSYRLVDLMWKWYELEKKGKITTDVKYKNVLEKYAHELVLDITKYTKPMLQEFINKIDVKAFRTAQYAYDMLKNTFRDAMEQEIITRNVMQFIKRPKTRTVKGEWFNIAQQKILWEAMKTSKIGNEILFYILTGCRSEEAYSIKIDWDNLIVTIRNGKRKKNEPVTYRQVHISQEYADILRPKWESGIMFKYTIKTFGKYARQFLDDLKLYDKSIHDLRHTYITNLFYLGVNDGKRQAFAGHKSIMMTQDIYTTVDLTVKKSDIRAIYGNLYPDYDKLFE